MKKEETKKFKFQSKKIPEQSGCYVFWDQKETVLYVGKAKNLRKRVASYFQKTDHAEKTKIMVSKINRIETHITNSEMEALILENNLIKEHMPRFNIRLRDDKGFVYLHITKEEMPRMEITRRFVRDGSTYIGPKTSTKSFRNLIRFCQKFFHIRMVEPSKDYYPDVISGKYNISLEEYQSNVERLKKFLRGQTREVEQELVERMLQFASQKNFEAAQKIKETLSAIQVSTQKQNVSFEDETPRDFIFCERHESKAYCVRVAFREGKMLDQNEGEMDCAEFLSDEEVYEAFLRQFYQSVSELPEEIYTPFELPNADVLSEFLQRDTDEKKIKIKQAQRGEKKQVLGIVQKRALHMRDQRVLENMSRAENFSKALPELALALGIDKKLTRIECFDISHFGGESTVASQVVFLDGVPQKSEYRRFKIKSLPEKKIDDFASMKEVLARRFARKDDEKFAEKFPDLIIIDGGKGQLSSVMKAVDVFLKENQFPDGFEAQNQIIGLAKREEEIFRPYQKEPLLLSLDSGALKLLQRVRDEAHRFAITYNRQSRQKKAHTSVLDTVKGIGPKTKKELLHVFGSVGEIRKASDESLRKILNETQFNNLRKSL